MLFHLLWRMGVFLCQHETSKIKNTIVRNSFSAAVYTACNIKLHHPLLRFLSAQKTFFHCFYMKEHHWLCTTEIIPPFAQNGTSYSSVVLYKVKRRHCYCTPCSVSKREKFGQFNTSLNYIYMYINIPSQYDIVSMAKWFHIGFYAKCKKMWWNVRCCIFRLDEAAFWATSWQNQQKWPLCPAKTQICLGIRPVWSVFAVRSMGSLGPSFASVGQRRLWSDLAVPWLIWIFAGRTDHFAVAQFSYWNHFRNHCAWHCNEFAYALLTWYMRCSQTTPRWQHD